MTDNLLPRPVAIHSAYCQCSEYWWRPARLLFKLIPSPGEWLCHACHPPLQTVVKTGARGRPHKSLDLALARQLRKTHGWLTLAREYQARTGQIVSKQTLMRAMKRGTPEIML